jgi:hypothetical protein
MSIEKKNFIIMNQDDNCATALEDIPMNIEIKFREDFIRINQKISIGHKFALFDIKKGDLIKKYGEIIGIATEDIKIGDWIHIHNLKSHYLEEMTE